MSHNDRHTSRHDVTHSVSHMRPDQTRPDCSYLLLLVSVVESQNQGQSVRRASAIGLGS